MKPDKWTAVGAPFFLVAMFIFFEISFGRDHVTHVALDNLGEVAKKALEMNGDLAKFFIGLSTAIIGAVAYYLKSTKGYAPRTGFFAFLVAAVLISSAVSIFFGHMWLALMRNQIVSDYLDLQAPGIVWSERTQYVLFLMSLAWVAVLVWERETARPPSPPGD